MSKIPSVLSEFLSVDNLPTGAVLLKMRQHEMPDRICVERHWIGMKAPDKRVYVPKRTAKRIRVPYQSHVAIGHYECGACGETVEPSDRYCSACGAELEDE